MSDLRYVRVRALVLAIVAVLAAWLVINTLTVAVTLGLFGNAAVGLLFPGSAWPVPIWWFLLFALPVALEAVTAEKASP